MSSAPKVKVGLVLRFEAKPGKEAEFEQFMLSGFPEILSAPLTIQWYFVKYDATHFGVVDSFAGDEGRTAHMNADFVKLLYSRVDELLVSPPSIEYVDILAAKLP